MSKGARTRRQAGSDVGFGAVYPPVGVDRQIGAHRRAAPSRPPGEAGGAVAGQIPARALRALAPGSKVHLIGIGGCGMSGAAAVLKRRGVVVSGSDRLESNALVRLAEQGVTVRIAQGPENLPPQCNLVVHSAAVKESNLELKAARQRGLEVIKYAQLLGLLMADRVGIAVAGTHGKSTTSAMVSFVLRQAGLDPSFVIGATVEQLGGGSGVGEGPQFVVEACEYDRSFLNLRARFATILNIEEDHLDYYKDLEEIIESFRAFASLIPPEGLLVVNAHDRNAMRAVNGVSAVVETFGFTELADWRAEILGSARGRFHFRVWRGRRPLTELMLAIPGRHNVSNALAAMALCYHNGVTPEAMAQALSEFRGAYRRLTQRGQIGGVTVVDDYAHHPTEIQVTLKAAREYYNPRRMFVVFQPHQHSRTRFLLQDFAKSFGSADVVIVPNIYFVRDSQAECDRISACDLVSQIHLRGGDARHEPQFERIVEQLCDEVSSGDLVVTMGAGDVWRIADQLVACLAGRHSQSEELHAVAQPVA